ncbi:hypothetical protein ACFE04_016448 [Oxalis oulophora]
MELSTTTTTQAILNHIPLSCRRHSHSHHQQLLTLNSLPSRSSSIVSLPLKQQATLAFCSGLQSRSSLLVRATSSNEEPNQFIDESDGVATLEDPPPPQTFNGESFQAEVEVKDDDGQSPSFEFLDNLNIKHPCWSERLPEQPNTFDYVSFKVDSDNTYSLLSYGAGALVALYVASAVVSSIDTIPLFPKLMEVVGLGYSFWFTTRYLLFKKNREELTTKIEELKQQVLGSNDD